MLEQRRWIFHLEFARLGLLGILTWAAFPYFNLSAVLLLMAFGFVLFYKTIGKQYYSYLYR